LVDYLKINEIWSLIDATLYFSEIPSIKNVYCKFPYQTHWKTNFIASMEFSHFPPTQTTSTKYWKIN
jgi:hypothetical protein